jgi:hypothetical protein
MYRTLTGARKVRPILLSLQNCERSEFACFRIFTSTAANPEGAVSLGCLFFGDFLFAQKESHNVSKYECPDLTINY